VVIVVLFSIDTLKVKERKRKKKGQVSLGRVATHSSFWHLEGLLRSLVFFTEFSFSVF
jgi:hypothetical protein